MIQRYLGIDLGGCMSGNSAYCLIEGDGERFTVLSNTKEPKHKEYRSCAQYLYQQIQDSQAVKIAIDAPHSVPRLLYDANFTPRPRGLPGEIANPYLFRYCDYFIFEQTGLRPMPPAGDRIGRITARTIELLQRMKLPIINDTVIEVYPKQIALELGFADYKRHPQVLLQYFHIPDSYDEHQIDAFLAAYGAMMIDHNHTLNPQNDENEGWCYLLKLSSGH